MNVRIICVGSLKEKYFKEAAAEYSKRLSRFCHLEVIEVKDEKIPENASSKEELLVKEAEGLKILKYLPPSSFAIALDLNGNMLSSTELSSFISKCGLKGRSNIVFIIGGSLGLSKNVLVRADYKLCFSKMTFPHQLMRIFLFEQIYRSFKIQNGEAYHK
jgi:23S rRNA (pseudouridine1915-N3)-methyltransferase